MAEAKKNTKISIEGISLRQRVISDNQVEIIAEVLLENHSDIDQNVKVFLSLSAIGEEEKDQEDQDATIGVQGLVVLAKQVKQVMLFQTVDDMNIRGIGLARLYELGIRVCDFFDNIEDSKTTIFSVSEAKIERKKISINNRKARIQALEFKEINKQAMDERRFVKLFSRLKSLNVNTIISDINETPDYFFDLAEVNLIYNIIRIELDNKKEDLRAYLDTLIEKITENRNSSSIILYIIDGQAIDKEAYYDFKKKIYDLDKKHLFIFDKLANINDYIENINYRPLKKPIKQALLENEAIAYAIKRAYQPVIVEVERNIVQINGEDLPLASGEQEEVDQEDRQEIEKNLIHLTNNHFNFSLEDYDWKAYLIEDGVSIEETNLVPTIKDDKGIIAIEVDKTTWIENVDYYFRIEGHNKLLKDGEAQVISEILLQKGLRLDKELSSDYEVKVIDKQLRLEMYGKKLYTCISKMTGNMTDHKFKETDFLRNDLQIEAFSNLVEQAGKKTKIRSIEINKNFDFIGFSFEKNSSIFKQGMKIEYQLYKDGDFSLVITAKPLVKDFELNINFAIPKEWDKISWYGLGPYADNDYFEKLGCIGIYEKELGEFADRLVGDKQYSRRSQIFWLNFSNEKYSDLTIETNDKEGIAFDIVEEGELLAIKLDRRYRDVKLEEDIRLELDFKH